MHDDGKMKVGGFLALLGAVLLLVALVNYLAVRS